MFIKSAIQIKDWNWIELNGSTEERPACQLSFCPLSDPKAYIFEQSAHFIPLIPLQAAMHFCNSDFRSKMHSNNQPLSPILAFLCKLVDGKPEKTECHGGATFLDATDGVTMDILLETDKATSSDKSYCHGWLCISMAVLHQNYNFLQMARSRAEIWLGEVRI